MADRVYPLKLESPGYGTEFDSTPTELDPSEDHLDVRGVFLQNDTSDDETVLWTRDSSSRMTFIDSENPTPLTLTDLGTGGTGISITTHELLDTLRHALAEDAHQQITRSGGKVTNVTHWTDSGETQKIREVVVTRSGGKVSQLDVIQYDETGTEKVRITGTVTRSGGLVDHIDWAETVA